MKNIEKIVEDHTEEHTLDVEIRSGQYHIVLPADCGVSEAHALAEHLNALVDENRRPVLEAEISFFSGPACEIKPPSV